MVTTVSPIKLGIGDVMTITGKNFRKGKNKNTVVFKRDGGRAVFVKAPDATTTKIGVTVPAKLLPFLLKKKGKRTFTRFRVRVLSKKFAKKFTTASKSPMIGPDAIGGGTKDDCDGDKIKNNVDTDDDNDLIPDTLEATLGTDPCKRDTDGDGESDGWEYYSALDRNGSAKPAPFAKPYPNPLDGKDADIDHDGDGLTDIQEYTAWASYGGQQASAELQRRQPRLRRPRRPARRAWPTWTATTTASSATSSATPTATASRTWTRAAPRTAARITKAQAGRRPQLLRLRALHAVLHRARREAEQASPSRCARASTRCRSTAWTRPRTSPIDVAEGRHARLAVGRLRRRRHPRRPGRRRPRRRPEHHRVPAGDRRAVQATASTASSTPAYPNSDSRFCLLGSTDVDRDGIPNRDDTDDDGDGLPDTLEQQLRLDPLRADTDSDGVSDGFEYWSALDLNGAARARSRARRPTRTRSTAPTPTSTSTATASRSRRSTRPGTTPAGRCR